MERSIPNPPETRAQPVTSAPKIPCRRDRNRAGAFAKIVAAQAFLLILGLAVQGAAEPAEVSVRISSLPLPSQGTTAPDTGQAEAETQPPVLLEKALPAYPERARKAYIQGTVILKAMIDANGEVADLEVLQGLELGCTQVALEAAKEWRFEPATLRGEAISAPLQLSIEFRLMPRLKSRRSR